MKRASKAKEATITVTQTGSTIGIYDNQIACLKGLGLGRIGKTKVLNDTPAVRGLITKVNHLIKVEA
jgi:large subunit ribosomal protein L30